MRNGSDLSPHYELSGIKKKTLIFARVRGSSHKKEFPVDLSHIPHDLLDYDFKEPDQKKGYIYFLLDRDQNLLYVGQTVSLESRIQVHLNAQKIPFSKCKYFMCERNIMNDMEFEMIVKLCPPHNGPPPTHRYWVSLDRCKRLFPNFKGRIVLLKKGLKNIGAKNFHGYYHIDDVRSVHDHLFGGEACHCAE